MPSTWLPLLAFSAGAALVVAGVAAVYWPAGLVAAGLIVCFMFVDFGRGGDSE